MAWQVGKNGFRTALMVGALAGFFAQTAIGAPVLSIVATPDPAIAGSPIALDVVMTDIADLFGYQFTISFDPTVLQATSVAEGLFLASGGTTLFDGGTVDNTAGSISFAFGTLVGPIPGVTGSGVLEHITFDTVNAGTTALTFSEALFLDSTFGDIAVQASAKSLTVTPTVASVPEPGTFVLMALGLAGIAAVIRQGKTA